MLPDLTAAIAAGVGASAQMSAPLPAVPGRVLHVDGDYLAYWAGGIDNLAVCREVALNKMEALKAASQSESILVHLTDPASSKADRYIIAEVKPYQEQRSGKGKPQHWAAMREYLGHSCFDFKSKTWSEREADDGMAYCCAIAESAIAAKDKDMRMLPGVHVNWDDFEITVVKPGDYSVLDSKGKQYGLKWFWLQMLHGDTADNIPGLPKYINDKGKEALCGEKTAQRLLDMADNNEEVGKLVEGLYAGYYGLDWPQRLLEQALLLWLRRDRGATIRDVAQVLPSVAGYGRVFDYFNNKIKEAYAEVESLRDSSASC